jgi:hypothetical protein
VHEGRENIDDTTAENSSGKRRDEAEIPQHLVRFWVLGFGFWVLGFGFRV